MAYYRKRNYRRRLNRNYRLVRRYNYSRRYKRTKNSLSYKVYNLTRKVNRYISTYKPEIQQVRGNMINTEFKNNNLINPMYRDYKNLYEQTLQVYNQNPEARLLDIKSDLCRSFKLRLFGYFGLCPVDRWYQHPEGDEDFWTKEPYPETCYLRLVVATLKKGGGRSPVADEVFVSSQAPPTIPGYQYLSLINGPLQKNITSQLNILRTKVIKIDNKTPHKMFKINVKVPHYRKHVNVAAYGAGEVLVYYQLLMPTYLDTLGGDVHTPEPRFTLDYQLLYVDQN